jgi:hypothetical protein
MAVYKVRHPGTGLDMDANGKFSSEGDKFSTLRAIKQVIKDHKGAANYELLKYDPMLVEIASARGLV